MHTNAYTHALIYFSSYALLVHFFRDDRLHASMSGQIHLTASSFIVTPPPPHPPYSFSGASKLRYYYPFIHLSTPTLPPPLRSRNIHACMYSSFCLFTLFFLYSFFAAFRLHPHTIQPAGCTRTPTSLCGYCCSSMRMPMRPSIHGLCTHPNCALWLLSPE